jgi:GntR family transcriptional regulator, transcriptional repressor for pyruvate dehydrogenase complex
MIIGELEPFGGVLEPVELRRAGEQIAERLVTAIALGEFVPGQRLPSERALSALLGVSRKSVREALHSLVDSGYVEILRGRNGGAVVRQEWLPTSTEIVRRTLGEHWSAFEQLFDLRQLVEPLIARTAAERRTSDDLAAITAACAAYDAAPDRDASRAADAALHTTVADATHNDYLAALSRQIRAQVTLGFGAEPYTAAIREQAILHHGALVEAIAATEGERAAAIAREHFRLTEDALRRLAGRVEVPR